jgi:hypothetical protein
MIQRYRIRYPESIEDAGIEIGDGIWCKVEDAVQLEAENALLKTQHERDEKALRVLAEFKSHEYRVVCKHPEAILPESCMHPDCLIAYAKQEAAK